MHACAAACAPSGPLHLGTTHRTVSMRMQLCAAVRAPAGLTPQVNQRLSAERLQQLLATERAQREALVAEVAQLRAALALAAGKVLAQPDLHVWTQLEACTCQPMYRLHMPANVQVATSLHMAPAQTCPWGLHEWLGITLAPDIRAGGGAPAMESQLSTLTTCGFEVRTSMEATTG